MPRNRVIYQSEALFISPTGSATLTRANNSLKRIQSCNYSFSVERQDVNQYGELAAIDRLIFQEPTVNVDMTYYFDPTGKNESNLGLRNDCNTTGASTISNHMLDYIISSGANYDQKNVYIVTSNPGIDANNTGTTAMGSSGNYDGVIGIGNCFLSSWSLEAAVGSLSTVSCSFEGQNINFTGGTSFSGAQALNPSVNDGTLGNSAVTLPSGQGVFDPSEEIAAVRPGDITFVMKKSVGTETGNTDSPAVGLNEDDLKIQSVSVNLSIGREPIRKLGKQFAFSREITFPINCTMSVSAIVGDAAAANVYDIVKNCGDNDKYNCVLQLDGYIPGASSCDAKKSYIILKGAKLDSQSISSSIGANKSVTLELSAQIGINSGLHMAKAGTSISDIS